MVDPLVIKIDPEKFDNIPLILVFNTKVYDRNKTSITLQNPNYTQNYNAVEKQDENDEKKIEFLINPNDFINHYGNFDLIFKQNLSEIQYKTNIFIYTNDLILKNPKDRYELNENSNPTITIKYEFQYKIASDEIHHIIYYESGSDIKKVLSKNKYEVEKELKLIIHFESTLKMTTYVFDIFPQYDKNNSISQYQRCYLHFHSYLLRNEAIYINKENITNSVSFITLFKNKITGNPLIIKESNRNIICSSFPCHKSENNNYLCECKLNFGLRSSPGIITILYENQERQLFLILYTSKMEKCYFKNGMKDLEIFMEWREEMEYEHYLYFNDTNQKILTKYFDNKINNVIRYKYKTTTLSLSVGVFYLKSSIPSLNYTDHNPVDNENLYVTINPSKNLSQNYTSNIYSHNRNNQIVNITLDELEGINILQEIKLRKDANNEIIVKRGDQCKIEGNSFICDLKDKIYNFDDESFGNYLIYYPNECNNNEERIEGRIVIIKKGYSILSISPNWINKEEVKGSNLTLEYDDDLSSKKLNICLYQNISSKELIKCYPPPKNPTKFVVITLDSLDYGIYHVITYIDDFECYDDNLRFKVSDKILNFNFSHHYFVLKNNDETNKLIITVNDNSGQFGEIIEDFEKVKLIKINRTHFEYPIKKVGIIRFNYYDNDSYIIPINDFINVAQYYQQFFSFDSLKSCYYFEFDISINNIEKELNSIVFLKSTDNITILNLSLNQNKYNIIMNETYIEKDYYLYISEEYLDQDVFLYKSSIIQFTEINVPTYIIDPNTTIVFSKLKCDLSKSSFEMIKMNDSSIQKNLINCKYNNVSKTLTCNILGTFYLNNRYKHYYYIIDGKNISNINKTIVYNTFVSKKLNEALFNISYTRNQNNFYFSIKNKEKDFYFPLLECLTTDKKQYYRGITNDFKINDENFEIEMNYTLIINEILNILYIKRKQEYWENERNIINETLYHFFNLKVDNKLFSVYPTIFAYNNITKEEYEITIAFYNDDDIKFYNKTKNLKDCKENKNIKCIDFSSGNFRNGYAQNYTISIGDGNGNYGEETIEFIYYELTDESKKCQTKTEKMNNLKLNVYSVDETLLKNLKLEGDISIINETKYDGRKQYILNSSEINLKATYLDMFLEDEIFYHSFTLQDIGLKILPKYYINLNDNSNQINLLKGNNQSVRVSLYVEDYSNINYEDIQGFKIKNNGINYNVTKKNDDIDNKSLYLIFNIPSDSINNYTLYYVDFCGEDIETNIKVLINTFTIKRHYFVLDNNLNMTKQYIKIEGPHEDNIFIKAYKDKEYIGIINYNSSSKYYFIELDQNSKGNYNFYVSNNFVESPINGTVYVKQNLEDFFKIVNWPLSCIFLEEGNKNFENINYTISSLNTEYFNDIRIFKSKFTFDKKEFSKLDITNDDLNKETFLLQYTNDIKSKIKINQIMYIFLTENDDVEQPIYSFNYSYSSIELNSEFNDCIYTDANYILFNMNCHINNIKPFDLVYSNTEKYSFTCEDENNPKNFNKENGIYKCSLSNKNDRNGLLKIATESFNYGYYDIKYSNNYKINKDKIFISQAINDSDFDFEIPEDIIPDRNTTVKINMGKKKFYSPNTDKVFYNRTEYNQEYTLSQFESIFEYFFERNNNYIINNNYITILIPVLKGYNYYISKICRKPCKYCNLSDCRTLKSRNIHHTTPIVTFDFDKHYIALENSTDNSNKIDSLTIEVKGETDQIDCIYYSHIKNGIILEEGISNINNNNVSIIEGLKVGKYTFKYRIKDSGKNVTIINDVVLVVNYDYEMFDYKELKKNCFYYKEENRGILVSITKNLSYEFQNDVVESDMELIFTYNAINYDFSYTKDIGYQRTKSDLDYKNNKFDLYLKEKKPQNFFFSEISKSVTLTKFDLGNCETYFYKDNIILENQDCYLDNIYILPRSNLIEPYSRLKCNYSNTYKKSICDAIDYTFSSLKGNNFEIYIGNKRQNNLQSYFFDTDKSIYIYNSINKSDFSILLEDSTISIISPNFDLSKINQIKINDNYISSDYFVSSIDLITYEFIINNNSSSEYYLNQLQRANHGCDIENNGIIKVKNVSLKIESKKCPEFKVLVGQYCISCLDKANSEGNGRHKYYQNGLCVDRCSEEEGYSIYNSELFYCLKCNETTRDKDNVLYCGCLEGTVKSDKDGVCYLPEDNRIKQLLLYRANMQCYRGDGSTHNYCNNNNTEICEVKSNSGYYFPSCVCKKGFIGRYCEFKENITDINLNLDMDVILNSYSTQNNIIDQNNARVISKIRGITYFFENKNYTDKIIKITDSIDDKIDKYIDSAINCIELAKKNNITSTQIYDVIELAISFIKLKLQKLNSTNKVRKLQDYNGNLNTILENAHYLNYLAHKDMESNYHIQTDELNYISFINYKKDAIDNSFKEYIKAITNTSKIAGYIKLNSNNEENGNLFFITLFNNELFNESNGIVINFSTNNKNENLDNLKIFNTYLYSSNFKVNSDLANYYQMRNISIYNKYDDCFNKSCYFNKHFPYDLTQKYRKKNVFQKWSLQEDICKYISFENSSNCIELSCEKFLETEKFYVNNDPLNYAVLALSIKNDFIDKNDTVYMLPMICPKEIDSLEGNYAFWLYLIICVLEIIYIIGINILTLGSLRKVSIRKGLVNDELYNVIKKYNSSDSDNNSNDEALKKKTEKIDYKSSHMSDNLNENFDNNSVENYFNKSLPKIIFCNFKELHPLSTLCRVSIISPLILNSWFFVFNILTLFGFNALIYWEGLIEKRIYDKKRSHFDYPMRKEFHKIIFSILCQIALTALIKLIVLVTLEQRDELKFSLKNCTLTNNKEVNNEVISRIDQFEDKMLIRRLIGGILMVIIVVFFFYYTVVFCGIYIKTQKNWLFSGIWSLFWNWVIFAPIYIMVISFLENKKTDSYHPLVYYLKKLFFF